LALIVSWELSFPELVLRNSASRSSRARAKTTKGTMVHEGISTALISLLFPAMLSRESRPDFRFDVQPWSLFLLGKISRELVRDRPPATFIAVGYIALGEPLVGEHELTILTMIEKLHCNQGL